jgi:hypothetical protein
LCNVSGVARVLLLSFGGLMVVASRVSLCFSVLRSLFSRLCLRSLFSRKRRVVCRRRGRFNWFRFNSIPLVVVCRLLPFPVVFRLSFSVCRLSSSP